MSPALHLLTATKATNYIRGMIMQKLFENWRKYIKENQDTKQIGYHVTLPEYSDGIRENGLLPGEYNDDNMPQKGAQKRIYFWPSYETAVLATLEPGHLFIVSDGGEYKGPFIIVKFQYDVPSRQDTNFDDKFFGNADHGAKYIATDGIPPEDVLSIENTSGENSIYIKQLKDDLKDAKKRCEQGDDFFCDEIPELEQELVDLLKANPT